VIISAKPYRDGKVLVSVTDNMVWEWTTIF